MPQLLAAIPSPPFSSLDLGPLSLHLYGLAIALGCVGAIWLSSKRWQNAGGTGDDVAAVAIWAIPAGIIGARLYHVATDFHLYRDNPLAALAVWDGGLGIWGGVAAGAIVGFVVAKRRNLDALALADIAAPAIALAQAIGRWGNYFNQELYGRTTDVPWALEIDIPFRPLESFTVSTYHPLFLYESLWNLVLCAGLLLVAHKFRVAKGNIFVLYVAGYTFARFFLEQLRVDSAYVIAGMRINAWMALILFVGAVVLFAIRQRRSSRQPMAGAEPG